MYVRNFLPDTDVLIESSCAFRQAFDKLLAAPLREIDDDDDDDDDGDDDNSVNLFY
jgi:hypothetical protein